MAESIALNMDCMEYMATLPDNAFDLAIVDPPYGGGANKDGVGLLFHGGDRWNKYRKPEIKVTRVGGNWGGRYGNKIAIWDIAPSEEYFKELARVSKNQVIWGGNYFELPPTRCFIVWRKLTISENFSMAMAEYAWTSFNDNAKVFEAAPQGKKGDERFHPTQKPVALYEWLLTNYAKEGDRILDTHLGSGSSRIAAYNLGFDFVGCEIDKEFFDKQEERFEKHTAQTSLFIDGGFT